MLFIKVVYNSKLSTFFFKFIDMILLITLLYWLLIYRFDILTKGPVLYWLNLAIMLTLHTMCLCYISALVII
jgi:hypothetical protein